MNGLGDAEGILNIITAIVGGGKKVATTVINADSSNKPYTGGSYTLPAIDQSASTDSGMPSYMVPLLVGGGILIVGALVFKTLRK